MFRLVSQARAQGVQSCFQVDLSAFKRNVQAMAAVPQEIQELPHPDIETAREVSAKMTKARAKAMVRELLSGYAAKSFQAKLTEILDKEAQNDGGVVTDELPARWAWAENVHNDILAQYGFATGHGMDFLTLPLELILKNCPDCLGNVQKIGDYLRLKTWPVCKDQEARFGKMVLETSHRAVFCTVTYGWMGWVWLGDVGCMGGAWRR